MIITTIIAFSILIVGYVVSMLIIFLKANSNDS
jgi:hypothetical protein